MRWMTVSVREDTFPLEIERMSEDVLLRKSGCVGVVVGERAVCICICMCVCVFGDEIRE